jgi:hypothetical protein
MGRRAQFAHRLPLEPGRFRTGVVSAKVVNLGEWSEDAPSALELHEPETTDLVVTLGFRH